MAKKSRRRPPCPDPEKYEWVNSREGGYWRRKRESSFINDALKENNANLVKVSPLSKAIREALQPFLMEMDLGRLGNRMNKLLMMGRKATGKTDVGALTGMDFQKVHRLEKILPKLNIAYEKDYDRQTFTITLPSLHRIVREWPNPQVTDYRFGLIMVYGQKGKNKSPGVLHSYSQKHACEKDEGEITIEIPLMSKLPWWVICLQFECFESIHPIASPKNRRMRVLDAEGVV